MRGFTLVELSIVLVIIGLLVGGILVGKDLIKAAEVRAQVSQIERYNTAVNTFKGKYNNYLPGDIPNPDATNFGFIPRGIYAGEGDGNGVLEGVTSHAAGTNFGWCGGMGESPMVWVDLSAIRLIDDSLTMARPDSSFSGATNDVFNFLPRAKIGNSNYVYVYSANGQNYFGISAINQVGGLTYSWLVGFPNFTPVQALSIDSKMDDGLPQSGFITAMHINAYQSGSPVWASGGGTVSQQGYVAGAGLGAAPGVAASATDISCYDNAGNASAAMKYSVSYNNGKGLNCALSFKFQ